MIYFQALIYYFIPIVLLFLLFLLASLFYWTKILSDNTRRTINESIKPEHIDLGFNAEDLKRHAIEYWRLKERINKIKKSIPDNDSRAVLSSLKRLERIFDNKNLRIQDMTGSKFNDGMNVEIVRAEEKENNAEATIIETLEPAIYIDDILVNKSKVVIKK